MKLKKEILALMILGCLGAGAMTVSADNIASGESATAVGYENKASGEEASALGDKNKASGKYSSAVGAYNEASEEYSSALGNNNLASGKYSSAVGFNNLALGTDAAALGDGNNASEMYSSAVGCFNDAFGEASSAFGYGNTASGTASTAVGIQSGATGDRSTAMGYDSYAGAEGATAIGYQAVATETGTVSFGHKSGESAGSYKVTYKYKNDDGEIATAIIMTYKSYAVGEKLPQGMEVTACEAITYDSDSFARLTNVADGKNKNDAATFGQIAAKEQTITGANNVLKDNNGDVIATFKLGSASFTAGDNVEISDDNVISVKADGKVEEGNTGIVTGGEVYDHLSGIRSDLEGQINKVGAGAAALAMLHSEGFDPANKWNFAVGYGHYKNANAGALGAFYKPNADTTVTVASTMGNGNPMFGAGVSFKIGQRGQNFAPNASNAELAAEVNRLRAENEQIKAQMAEILRKLSLSKNVNKSAR